MPTRVPLPPWSLPSADRPWPELEPKVAKVVYAEWVQFMPEYLQLLTEVLKSENIVASDFETKTEYISRVGEWLAQNSRLVSTAHLPPHYLPGTNVDVRPHKDIDLETASLCHYVGYLFSETIRTEAPNAYYVQYPRKRFIYYQCPVLIADHAKGVVLEPVMIVANVTSGLLDPTKPNRPLGELYDFWLGYFKITTD